MRRGRDPDHPGQVEFQQGTEELQWFYIDSALATLLLFSRSVMFGSLQHHGLQHARLLCPSPSPGACSNSCPSSW